VSARRRGLALKEPSGNPTYNSLPFWPLLACPACGRELFALSHGVGCSKCKISFVSDGEFAQIDLRLRVPKTCMMTFIVGDTTELPPGVVTERIPANPTTAIANWSDVKIPAKLTDGNRLTPELLSYFPKSGEPGRWMLDLGCGGDTERAFFEQLTNLNYLGVDWTSRTADLLADAHSLPFKDEGFDLVVCIAVLEHVKMPDIVMSEARRVLKPGGLLIGTSAFLEPFHLNSYEHMTHLAIHRTLSGAGFEVILISPNRQWSVLRAQAEMSLFPIGALPRWLRRTSVAPLEVASRGAWALKRRLGKKRASELQRLLETTGGFRFVARRTS
jgi:SAM-dependent methyltransferase